MYAITITSIALLASSVVAQGTNGLPSCASSCVGNSFGSCGTLDVKCICSDSSLISGLACCVSTACDPADQELTIKFADSLCAGQGVTNLPTSATCASTGTPTSRATPVPQGGSTGSSGSMSMTSTMTGSASSAAASVSSAISSASSAATSAAASASSSAMSAQSSASGSGTSSAAAQTQSSAAMANKMASAGFGMAVVGLVAAL